MRLVLTNYFRQDQGWEVDAEDLGGDGEVHEGFAGYGAILGDTLVGLLLVSDNFYVQWGDQSYSATETSRVTHAKNGDHATLVIEVGGSILATAYHPGPPVSTPCYSEDEEDADFGLWICNILNSPQRMAILLERWPACARTPSDIDTSSQEKHG